MSLPRLWAFLAVALPTLGAIIASLQSVDLAYHLRAGAGILDTRAIPSVDTWTFTAAGLPWTDQQWGAQVVLAAAYRLGGWTGLVLLRAGLVAVIFGCLFEVGRRRGLGLRRAAWLTLAAFVVGLAALALRPQLFGMAFFAVVLLIVADRRQHPARLWLVPVIVLVWANIHGSFFLGPLVLGLAWLEDIHDRVDRSYRTLAAGVVAALAACVTPFGPSVWVYAVGLSTNPEVTRRISEWQPTSLRDAAGLLFFGSALALAIVIARRGRSVPWPMLAWVGVFFLIGLYAERGIAWWPLGVVAACAGLFARGGEPSEAAGPQAAQRLNAVLVVAIVVASIGLLPVLRSTDPATGVPTGVVANAPLGITASLREMVRPGDRLLNPQPWGSWFEFAVPQIPLAIDSRIELFPSATWDEFDIATAARGRETILQLRAWDVTIAVVVAGDGLREYLVNNGWQTAYADRDGSVLVAPSR